MFAVRYDFDDVHLLRSSSYDVLLSHVSILRRNSATSETIVRVRQFTLKSNGNNHSLLP
jgi:hypothetical protein